MAMRLRPLSLGELLDSTFRLYRNNFVLFIGIVLPPQLVLLAAQFYTFFPLLDAKSAPDFLMALGGIAFRAIIAVSAYWMCFVLAQAATTHAVSELYLQRNANISNAYSRSLQRLWPLMGLASLILVCAAVGLSVFIIGSLFALAFSALAIPAMMTEGLGPIASIRRSVSLVKGRLARIALAFAVFVVLFWSIRLVVGVVALGLLLVFRSPRNADVTFLIQRVDEFIAQVLACPVLLIAITMIYYDQRVRKEALDLSLMRVGESRSATKDIQ